MHRGSCLCGKVAYQIEGEVKKVSHCHCQQCQKQHGAAFATYASVLKSQLQITGEIFLKTYASSAYIKRQFCGDCGSSLFWSGHPDYLEWISFTLASLDTEYKPGKIQHIYTDTKACWLEG